MDFIINIIIVSATSIIGTFIFSIIILSAFFGIPQTIRLKKINILSESATIRPYWIAILTWTGIVFISLFFLFNVLKKEFYIGIIIGIILAIFNSLKSLSDDNFYINIKEVFTAQSKHINPIINKIYDYSLEITENLNKLLTGYDYNNYVDNNRNLFVSISCMICFYFFEVLLSKDYNYTQEQCSMVNYCLLIELDSHIEGVDFQTTNGAYNEIKQLLSSPQIDNENQLPEYIAFVFLNMALQNFELEEIEVVLLYDIYNEFNNIMQDKYNL